MSALQAMLSPEKLALLRSAYAEEPNWLAENAVKTLTATYPGAAGMVGALHERFFLPNALTLDVVTRELCLVFHFAGGPRDVPVALHIYWALMLGATAESVAETLLLAGAYRGIECYYAGLRVLERTLGDLGKLTTHRPADCFVALANNTRPA